MKKSVIFLCTGLLAFYDLFKYFINEPQPESPSSMPTKCQPSAHTHTHTLWEKARERLNMHTESNELSVHICIWNIHIKCTGIWFRIESDNLEHATRMKNQQSLSLSTFTHLPCERSTNFHPTPHQQQQQRKEAKDVSVFQLESIFEGFISVELVWRPNRFISAHSIYRWIRWVLYCLCLCSK